MSIPREPTVSHDAFIMHQQSSLGASVQQVDIPVGKIQRRHLTAAGINDRRQRRDSATFPAAAYQHHQQTNE